MPVYKELNLDQGASYFSNTIITDSLTGANVNVASYSFTGQLRRSYYSANASANLVFNVSDAANGRIQFSLPANVSSNLAAGRYVYDVKATLPGNLTMRIQEGVMTIFPQVTR